jgi:hypothetical protein
MTLVHSGVKNASIPTGADLNWRTVWPGQWTCDNVGYIWADSLKGGRTHMIDVRGWGYLTGRGMGALDLDAKEAERLQDELGALLCAAPELLKALTGLADAVSAAWPGLENLPPLADARAAIRKATTANSVGTETQGVEVHHETGEKP